MAQEAPASVLCVCLGAKLFTRHLKSAHPPTLGSFSPSSIQLPPLNLCADNEMQTNHVGETSAKCRAERRFMGAKWKYYHKQKTRGGAKRGRVWSAGGAAVSQGQLPARVINICCCCCCRGQLAAKIACLLLDFLLPLSFSLSPLPSLTQFSFAVCVKFCENFRDIAGMQIITEFVEQ